MSPDQLKEIEREGDSARRVLIDELLHTYATPFDREDLFALSRTIDDILDAANETAVELAMYRIGPPEGLNEMARVLIEGARHISAAVRELLDHPGVAAEHAVRAKRSENRIDSLYHQAVAQLDRHDGGTNNGFVLVLGDMKKLDGIHHISSITADAPSNVAFYAVVMGLRLVKKTVNQDDPSVYHLFYADENASAGADMTFFEYPGVAPGRAGAGMIHRIAFRVASGKALDFWQRRLATAGIVPERAEASLLFADPEGLGLELTVADVSDAPLIAKHPEIPIDVALMGFAGVRVYSNTPDRSRTLLGDVLGFRSTGPGQFESRGERRGSFYVYDPAPESRGMSGAGTVHHVAWSSTMEDHAGWREKVVAAGARPTPIIDRYYFRSIYFREPSGVLFEIATLGPGFTSDEPLEHLGERISLPPNFEHLREEVERTLTPLPNPRAAARASTN